MKQVIGITLATILLILVLYIFLLFYGNHKTSENNTELVNESSQEFFITFAENSSGSKISMKQIDSVTAEMNKSFTIKNAVERGLKLKQTGGETE